MALSKVKEATYLTADNHARYRTIMRYFYIQHERMREFIFPEEVMSHVKSQNGFSDYDEDNLHIDLNQLVKWGNLTPRQEFVNFKRLRSIMRSESVMRRYLNTFPSDCREYLRLDITALKN